MFGLVTMSIKAVIFDLDGTITQPYFDFDAIRQEIGLDKDSGPILELLEKMGTEQRHKVEEVLHYHEQMAVTKSRLNPGAKKTVDLLRAGGIKVGVLTRNRRSNAMAVADKHGLKFDVFVGREDGPVKPDAYGVIQICKQFDVRPEETLMVGDYLFDLLCARSAGAVSVLLVNTERAAEFVEHADFTIEKIDEILAIVESKK